MGDQSVEKQQIKKSCATCEFIVFEINGKMQYNTIYCRLFGKYFMADEVNRTYCSSYENIDIE